MKPDSLKHRMATACLFVMVIALAGGCEPDAAQIEPESNYPEDFLRTEWPQEADLSAQTVHRTYRLRHADQIEIIYNVKSNDKRDEYRLKIRDVISVRFPFTPELSQDSVEIQADGMIQLPYVGSVLAYKMTVQELQKELLEKYSTYIKKPVINVTFRESRRDIADLREAITTSPRGQSRLVPVTPDGTVALPLIGTVMAAGRTVDEIYADINKQYQDLGLEDIDVTINVQTVSPLRVYVAGEVKRPGLVLNDTGTVSGLTHMSLLQALASAGSYLPGRAELSHVLLIRKKDVPSAAPAIINVRQILQNQTKVDGRYVANSSKFRHDIWLEDGDIIYVPTTEVAQRADYIEYVWTKGIYAVVPLNYTVQATYAASDTVDWLGPNP